MWTLKSMPFLQMLNSWNKQTDTNHCELCDHCFISMWFRGVVVQQLIYSSVNINNPFDMCGVRIWSSLFYKQSDNLLSVPSVCDVSVTIAMYVTNKDVCLGFHVTLWSLMLGFWCVCVISSLTFSHMSNYKAPKYDEFNNFTSWQEHYVQTWFFHLYQFWVVRVFT